MAADELMARGLSLSATPRWRRAPADLTSFDAWVQSGRRSRGDEATRSRQEDDTRPVWAGKQQRWGPGQWSTVMVQVPGDADDAPLCALVTGVRRGAQVMMGRRGVVGVYCVATAPDSYPGLCQAAHSWVLGGRIYSSSPGDTIMEFSPSW
ncbi:hypothetical protein JX265_000002 [Neoarthrinium moseri]|uniref:Uncharacterized protein n=1 Tax=Neoarthrinium moseri TaxID=1658444 RepID=A0A9Q0AV57_9PEZI|nr:hypothetical protein JX266_008184 [Neoarthrinium moseri]KAI1881176.1 hypothetical protein JX265_000002 [Neoarthrinium moseri]